MPRVGNIIAKVATSFLPRDVSGLLSHLSNVVPDAFVVGGFGTLALKGIVGVAGGISSAISLHNGHAALYAAAGGVLTSGSDVGGYAGILLNAQDSHSFTGFRASLSVPVVDIPGLSQLLVGLPLLVKYVTQQYINNPTGDDDLYLIAVRNFLASSMIAESYNQKLWTVTRQ